MRVIINGPAEEFDAGVRVARQEISEGLHRYDKPGWGWHFGDWWVCGLKDGISVKWSPRWPLPPQEPSNG